MGIRGAEENWCLHHALTPALLRLPPRHTGLGDWSGWERQEDIAEEVAKEFATNGGVGDFLTSCTVSRSFFLQ